MRLGIDASNLRAGGGVTHLVELLRAADPGVHGFSRVVVWSGSGTLGRIEDRPWLAKRHYPVLDGSLPRRALWQSFRLAALAREEGCDVLFVPGGTFVGGFRPVVVMSSNMLPFEWRELRRYGWSPAALKMILLRWTQTRSFRRAQGLIFLTRYAEETVMRVVRSAPGARAVVPHGIDGRFFEPPRRQVPIGECSAARPFRMLYVSVVEPYKHQGRVAEAVATLRRSGLPVSLDLVGPADPPALRPLARTLSRVDPAGEFVRYLGPAPHRDLHERYAGADLCVFASSCENLPNILLEGMASGLPVACSRLGPMPEVLGDAGVYFDPEDPRDIARALREMIDSPELRAEKAAASFERAGKYSWPLCARDTFAFLAGAAGAV